MPDREIFLKVFIDKKKKSGDLKMAYSHAFFDDSVLTLSRKKKT